MTDISRRVVLGAGASGIAATVVGAGALEPVLAAGAGPRKRKKALSGRITADRDLYRRQRFVRHERKEFRVGGPHGSQRMELASVRDLASAPGANRSFELTFRTRHAGPEQGTYQVKRRRFARTSLFLVPTDDTRRTYRAIVNNR